MDFNELTEEEIFEEILNNKKYWHCFIDGQLVVSIHLLCFLLDININKFYSLHYKGVLKKCDKLKGGVYLKPSILNYLKMQIKQGKWKGDIAMVEQEIKKCEELTRTSHNERQT